MSAQHAVREDDLQENEMLDADISAAVLRWLETARAPEGIPQERWQDWVDGGCQGLIEADGEPLTSAMLGHWARTGALR